MDARRGILVPRKILAVLLAWVVTVLEVAVPAYAVGGLGELRAARGMEAGYEDYLHWRGARPRAHQYHHWRHLDTVRERIQVAASRHHS